MEDTSHKKLYDMLDDEIRENSVLKKHLAESKKKVSEQEKFLDFLSIMIRQNHQFYWMGKFKDRMIAFFLTSVYEDAFSVVTDYVLQAYLSDRLDHPVYQAHLEYRYDTKHKDKRLYLASQSVNERSLRGHGIGTMSFGLIKKLAEDLRCDSIYGFRCPLEYFETEEERKAGEQKLYQLYDKLGFEQSAESDKIRFVLRK